MNDRTEKLLYSNVSHNFSMCNMILLQVPWTDLRYLFGEIMYGGHITDDWDRRLCRTYLEEYMKPEMVSRFSYAYRHYYEYCRMCKLFHLIQALFFFVSQHMIRINVSPAMIRYIISLIN